MTYGVKNHSFVECNAAGCYNGYVGPKLCEKCNGASVLLVRDTWDWRAIGWRVGLYAGWVAFLGFVGAFCYWAASR